jgi:hypothetical protein
VNRCLVVVIIVAALTAACATQPVAPPPRPRVITSLERDFLERQFDEARHVSDLPTEVRPLVALWPWPIAEPDQDYNWGCVVSEQVPMKRLMVAGRSGDLYAVLFESGGSAGPRPTLILARLREDHVTAYCEFSMPRSVVSLESAKDVISPSLYAYPSFACR